MKFRLLVLSTQGDHRGLGLHFVDKDDGNLPLAADFEDREFVASVDLVTGRVLPHALGRVPPQHGGALHVLEAELADPDARQAREVLGVRRLVPHLKGTNFDV